MSTCQSSPPPLSSALYAATCNPPRKAKRPRHDSVSLDPSRASPHPTSPNAHNVRIRPAPTQPASTAISIPSLPSTSSKEPGGSFPSGNSSIPEPASIEPMQLPPAKKRGRKPNNGSGGMSRSARESQRKINHSRIEKARRSKINDALDALRVLVPSNYGSEAQGSSPVSQSKKEEKDKEFKLDILERTVLYVRHLVHKVDELERKNGVSVSSFSTSATETINASGALKRRHEEVEEDLSDDDGDGDDEGHAFMREDEDRETEIKIPQSQVANENAETSKDVAAVQLPSISSWLGDIGTQPLDHQQPVNSPSTTLSPPLAASSIHRRELSMERRSSSRRISGFDAIRASEADIRYDSGLLSPPGSGRIQAIAQSATVSPIIVAGASTVKGSLPSLRLPSPRAGLASLLNEPIPATRPGPSRTPSKWTPEDENVASLLLQISSSASSTSASPPESSPLGNRRGSVDEQDLRAKGKTRSSPVMKKVQTPGAMLGIDLSTKGPSSGR